jgi:hypothetical protein
MNYEHANQTDSVSLSYSLIHCPLDQGTGKRAPAKTAMSYKPTAGRRAHLPKLANSRPANLPARHWRSKCWPIGAAAPLLCANQ